MSKIILYTTGCPKCKVLENKLNAKGIEYTTVTDFDVNHMINLGFMSVPILEVDENLMDFTQANKWINEQ